MVSESYVDLFEHRGLAGRFASIDCADCGGGYDWDQFHVLRGADGYLYVGSASGCSCNSFGGEDPSAFERVDSWQEAAAKALEWADERDWNREQRQSVVMSLVERLTRSRPERHLEIDPRHPFGSVR